MTPEVIITRLRCCYSGRLLLGLLMLMLVLLLLSLLLIGEGSVLRLCVCLRCFST